MSLTQQLAELDSAAPKEFDAEDGFEPIQDLQPQDAAREHYVDVGHSSLRKLADNELDPKYDAVKVSRQQLQDSDDDEDEEIDRENEDQPSGSASEGPGTPSDDDDDDDDEEEEDESSGEENAQNDDDGDAREEETAAAAAALQKTRQADIAKGKAVARQISVWDALIDTRIRLQKTIQATDKLPQQQSDALSSEDGQATLARFFETASALSNSLFEAQERLFELSTSTPPPPRKKRKLSPSSASVSEATHDLSQLNAAYHPHLLSTLTKWSNKIQAVTPALFANSNANAFTKKSANATRNILDVIDDTLARKHEREEGEGVYDDTDFYQSLLRDVIEARGGAAAGGVGVKRKKVKKVVDTKASKGRKIRYTVHEKLQHFMVPIPTVTAGGWHDEQIDELFASLLGKNATATGPSKDGQTDAASTVRVEDGFRLFG
ncbi:TRAUB-domain-containing protein [Auricularia subglabra TFB-10046 SS5]|nr:TRAUB-domain-containing protein [Auricularia subglabra TFB-10046 SS5]